MLGVLAAGNAQAISITAIATDDGTDTVLNGTQLQDGDFLIQANPGNPVFTSLGDGFDETLTWDFDFNTDPLLGDFMSTISSGASLKSAALTFDVTPTNSLITTDNTGIPDVQRIAIPDIPGVTESVGTDLVFTLELLDFGFDSTTLLNAFNTGEANSIPWIWQDDVVMRSASLTLKTPEPAASFGLLAVGLASLGMVKSSRIRTIERK